MTVYQYIAALLSSLGLVLSIGCGCPAPSSGSGGSGGAPATAQLCSAFATPCPGPTSSPDAGVFPVCEPGATQTTCCQDGRELDACQMPAGILVHDGDCPSGIAAISPKGAAVCCVFGPSNPCNTPAS